MPPLSTRSYGDARLKFYRMSHACRRNGLCELVLHAMQTENHVAPKTASAGTAPSHPLLHRNPVMSIGGILPFPHLLFALLVTTGCIRPLHAWSFSSKAATLGDPGALRSRITPALTTAMDDAGDMHVGDMHAVAPFVVSGADIHGPVSDELAAELLQESGSIAAGDRALLHGPKLPKKYPQCNRCRIIKCNSSTRCTGHCRRNLKLRFCSTSNIPAAACAFLEDPVIEDFEGLPPSNLSEFDTAVVSVPHPFMGCAEIGNLTTGCPARGTRATLPGMGAARVVTTRCRSEYYIPECQSPLLPFGLCECVYRSLRRSRISPFTRPSRPRSLIAPCRTSELAAGAGVGGGGASPSVDAIMVLRSGRFTETWFRNFTTPGQRPNHEYSVSATARSTDVNATLRIFTADLLLSDYVEEDGDPPDDYVPPKGEDPSLTAD